MEGEVVDFASFLSPFLVSDDDLGLLSIFKGRGNKCGAHSPGHWLVCII
jgi:hypothetical protein